MRAFWDQSRGGRNFGDALTAVLFKRLANVELTWSEPADAELFGAGSIAEAIPAGFGGFIFGSGKMFANSKLDLSEATVIALRGALTAEGAQAETQLLADPGLLAADLAPECDRDIPLGVIRHYVDRRSSLPFGLNSRDATFLNPLDEPMLLIGLAARCQRIASSSLHGLVLADALGIRNVWSPHPHVLGDGFKFRDYASAYGEAIEPYRWRLAPAGAVADKRNRLRAYLMDLAAS